MNQHDLFRTTMDDWPEILRLFSKAMELQGRNGYKVWDHIDKENLKQEIRAGNQYKIVKGDQITCIFSVQDSDPLIWRNRDNQDAIYLHRIVVNPACKGQRQFEKVLRWSRDFAKQHHRRYLRMDTWADNKKLIGYYQAFGFIAIENYTTADSPELPLQNRNLNVTLLELDLDN